MRGQLLLHPLLKGFLRTYQLKVWQFSPRFFILIPKVEMVQLRVAATREV